LEDELLEGKRFEESIFNMVSYIAAWGELKKLTANCE
jgi:hypothetical protein